jgi:O-antigen ligase
MPRTRVVQLYTPKADLHRRGAPCESLRSNPTARRRLKMLRSSNPSYLKSLKAPKPKKAAGDLAIVGIALGAGIGVAAGTKWGLLVAALALAFAAGSAGLLDLVIPRYSFGYTTIELPAIFILIASLGLRARTADDLTSNPLDFVGMLRLACTGLAFLLGAIAIISARGRMRETVTNRPLRVYMIYAAVALLGVLVSVSPALTAYRSFELVAAIVVIAGAYRTAGKEALIRLEGLLYWWIVLLLVTVWVGVALFPALTVLRINSPIPYQIQGVYPAVTTNTLGALAVFLFFWSVGRWLAPASERGPRRSVAAAIAAFGFVTLIASQYRTGYAAFMLGIALLFFLRGRKVLAGFGVTALVVGTIMGSRIASEATPILLRGTTAERAAQLNGRLSWWALALPIWRESPIIGGGLRTASRLLVLGAAGFGATSTVHSTWIEALVGTGVLGVAALLIFILMSLRRAFLLAMRPAGRIVPVLILAAMTVRSISGDTFESGGLYCLITLVFVMGLRDKWFGSKRVDGAEMSMPIPEPATARA